jgi:hypothetical protein
MTRLAATLTDFSMRSAVGTMGAVGANRVTKVRISGTGHGRRIRSEILHMGTTRTVPAQSSRGVRRWTSRQMAPPMDSPKRKPKCRIGPRAPPAPGRRGRRRGGRPTAASRSGTKARRPWDRRGPGGPRRSRRTRSARGRPPSTGTSS